MNTRIDYADVIPSNIARIIKAKGIKQSYVAELSGFSNQQFSDIVHRKKVIRAEFVPRIAAALGVSIPELYEHDGRSA